MIGVAVLMVTLTALAVTAAAQIWPLRRLRFLLDSFALVPEWRFFAQASTLGAIDLARDTHLVVRDRDAAGRVGGWQPVLSYAERRLRHIVWNPQARVDIVILTHAEDLAHSYERDPQVQQSLRYLILLRRALEAPRHGRDAVDRQFAVVHTIGRIRREIGMDFLSAWHRW